MERGEVSVLAQEEAGSGARCIVEAQTNPMDALQGSPKAASWAGAQPPDRPRTSERMEVIKGSEPGGRRSTPEPAAPAHRFSPAHQQEGDDFLKVGGPCDWELLSLAPEQGQGTEPRPAQSIWDTTSEQGPAILP